MSTEPTETIEEETPATRRDTVKFVASAVVGTSVSSVIKNLIRQNMVPKNKFQNVEMFVAAFALGGLVAKQATAATDDTVDKYADMYLKFKAKVNTDSKVKDTLVSPDTPE